MIHLDTLETMAREFLDYPHNPGCPTVVRGRGDDLANAILELVPIVRKLMSNEPNTMTFQEAMTLCYRLGMATDEQMRKWSIPIPVSVKGKLGG